MQITFDLPDNLALTEPDLRREVAILLWRGCANALFQQNILLIEQAAQVIAIDVDDFYQILVDRGILTPPSDPDDDPNELILAHLRISLQQAEVGNLKPISELWDGIDDRRSIRSNFSHPRFSRTTSQVSQAISQYPV